jgi:hypothetical protein
MFAKTPKLCVVKGIEKKFVGQPIFKQIIDFIPKKQI